MKKAVCEVARRGFIWQVSRRVTVREIQKNDVRLQIKKFLGGFRNLSSSGRRRPESFEEALRLLEAAEERANQEREGRLAERERANQEREGRLAERERANQEREGRRTERERANQAEGQGRQGLRIGAESNVCALGSQSKESNARHQLVGNGNLDEGALSGELNDEIHAAQERVAGETYQDALDKRASKLFSFAKRDPLTSFIMNRTPADRKANQNRHLPDGMNQVTENLVNRTVNHVLQTVMRSLDPMFMNLRNEDGGTHRRAVLYLHNNVDRVNNGQPAYSVWQATDLDDVGYSESANLELVSTTQPVRDLLQAYNSAVSNTDGILALKDNSGQITRGSILQTVEVKKELFGSKDKKGKTHHAAAQGLGLSLWGGSEDLRVQNREPIYTIITDGNQWQLVRARLRRDEEWHDLFPSKTSADFYEIYDVSASDRIQFTGDRDNDREVIQTLMAWMVLTRDVWRSAAEPLDLTKKDLDSREYVYARPSDRGNFDPSVFGECGRALDNGGVRIHLVLDHDVPGFRYLIYDGAVEGKAATIKFTGNETRWRNEIVALRKLEDLGISEGVPQVVFEGKVGLGSSSVGGILSYRDCVIATNVRGQAWSYMVNADSSAQKHWMPKWVDDIAQVLDALENAGLVHGDVKPANVIIADFPPTMQVLDRDSLDGRARLIDWEGLSTATSVAEAKPGTSPNNNGHRFTWTFASTPMLLDCAQTCLDDWESLGYTVIDRLCYDNEIHAEWERILDRGFRDPAEFEGGAQEYFVLLERRSNLLGVLLQSDMGREIFGDHLGRVAAAHERGRSLLQSGEESLQIAYDLVEDHRIGKRLNAFATEVVKQLVNEKKPEK